jgi:hypothetical protein
MASCDAEEAMTGVKLTKVQSMFLTTLSAHSLFVRRTQVAYLRPLVKSGLVEASQDESGFYCCITEAGRAALASLGDS